MEKNKSKKKKYKEIIDGIIKKRKGNPIDLLNRGIKNEPSNGEFEYLKDHRSAYIRTLKDIEKISDKESSRVLEIGSFLGVVSMALSKLGYDVHAVDIPEYAGSETFQKRYKENGVSVESVNLRERHLPYQDEEFDIVVMCEVLEHLNFNPLLCLQEINRVTKKGGNLYLSTPNLSHITNRIKLLTGNSIHNPPSDFKRQLDKEKNFIVGIHWREYTKREVKKLLKDVGFKCVNSYYFHQNLGRGIISMAKKAVYKFRSLRPYCVYCFEKEKRIEHDFWLTDANT
jgi:2-polyprenyl-3-methyl-5-hydroxy-6-metoxy-1,4-benzoquinol methylase